MLHNQRIRNIAIVGDLTEARSSMSDMVQDAGFFPIPCNEITERSVDDFVSRITRDSDAAVLDHSLSSGGYANFDGGDVVAQLYDRKFPAILLTQVQGYERIKIVSKRRKIPCLLDGSKVDPEQINEGLERCIKEFEQGFLPDRRSYKTIVRIESVDLSEPHRRVVDLVVPAWATSKSIKLPYDYVYEMINVDLQPNMHLVAEVNIGAASSQDLYVANIEVAEEIEDELAEYLTS